MNEKFYTLSEEKQQRIINAAMEVFSKYEYKKASTDLIAAKAGVSKGLLFYYFHNKQEMYLFLYNYLMEIMKGQIVDREFETISDFFELLEYAARKKVRILQKNPYIMDFSLKAFYSEKEAVSCNLKKIHSTQEDIMYQIYFKNIDTNKFKEGIEPDKVYKMLLWMADGYMHYLKMSGHVVDAGTIWQEFQEWTGMLRKWVYKEEYQNERH